MKHKSILVLSISLLGALMSFAQVKNDSIKENQVVVTPIFDERTFVKLDNIEENTKQTDLAKTDTDDWYLIVVTTLSLFGAFISMFFNIKTVRNTKKTEIAVINETEQKQIKTKFQEKLLLDLIRHLYRNKIVVCALRWKLSEKDKKPNTKTVKTENYNLCYPSEEHLLKLKVLPEDLRLDRFENAPEHYDALHKLELYFRNYNIEIDVTLDHLKQKNMTVEVKDRDLDTLEFKSGFLTAEIDKLMIDLKLPHDIFNCLQNEAYDKIHEKNGSIKAKIKTAMETDNYKKWEQENFAIVPKRKDGDYYDKLNLTDCINKDITIEYLKEGTINLIKF